MDPHPVSLLVLCITEQWDIYLFNRLQNFKSFLCSHADLQVISILYPNHVICLKRLCGFSCLLSATLHSLHLPPRVQCGLYWLTHQAIEEKPPVILQLSCDFHCVEVLNSSLSKDGFKVYIILTHHQTDTVMCTIHFQGFPFHSSYFGPHLRWIM